MIEKNWLYIFFSYLLARPMNKAVALPLVIDCPYLNDFQNVG